MVLPAFGFCGDFVVTDMDDSVLQSFSDRKLNAFSPVLKLLLDGAYYARDANRSPWDFALSFNELTKQGLEPNDLRWLVSRGWLQHGEDITQNGDESRVIRQRASLVFDSSSHFVLSENGITVVSSCSQSSGAIIRFDSSHECSLGYLCTPRWDAVRHELFFGNHLVKRFRWPAENQQAILAAFQEEGWPKQIDDPLPPTIDIDSKRRLADTIKCLNRNQITPAIRFRGDGTGEGVLWDDLSKVANTKMIS